MCVTFFLDISQNLHTAEIYAKLNILHIKDIYKLRLGNLIFNTLFKGKYSKFKVSLDSLTWTHNWNTRKIDIYRLPKTRICVDHSGVLFSSVALWNELPLHVRNASSIVTFNKLYKAWLSTESLGWITYNTPFNIHSMNVYAKYILFIYCQIIFYLLCLKIIIYVITIFYPCLCMFSISKIIYCNTKLKFMHVSMLYITVCPKNFAFLKGLGFIFIILYIFIMYICLPNKSLYCIVLYN